MTNKDAFLARWSHLTDAMADLGEEFVESVDQLVRESVRESSAEWTVQDSREFHGQEVQSWKSKTGQWAFGYGTWLSGVVALETLVTGFETEDKAFEAAYRHCHESACESAASQVEE